MGGFCSSLQCCALSISKGKISFVQQIWAMRKITTLQRDAKMAKDLCLSFTTVNRLVLRRTIEFQATNKRVHKFENRGEKLYAVLISTSQLYSPQVPDKRGLEPNISRL